VTTDEQVAGTGHFPLAFLAKRVARNLKIGQPGAGRNRFPHVEAWPAEPWFIAR
jgi:hypothetical protein